MDLAGFACFLDLRPMDFGVSAVYEVQLFAEGFRTNVVVGCARLWCWVSRWWGQRPSIRLRGGRLDFVNGMGELFASVS